MLPSHGRSRGFESLVAHHPPHPHDLLLLRHGETEWNRAGRFQGALDSALTAEGVRQAVALGRLLGALGVGPGTHAAWASPQPRARETARLALGAVGLQAAEDVRLVEIGMGLWAGLHRDEIARRWPGPEGEGVLPFYARCPEGEALEEVAGRARAVLAGLTGPAVIVTHGITLRVLAALALGGTVADAEAVRVPQGCLLRIANGRAEVLDPGALRAGAPAASPAATGG